MNAIMQQLQYAEIHSRFSWNCYELQLYTPSFFVVNLIQKSNGSDQKPLVGGSAVSDIIIN